MNIKFLKIKKTFKKKNIEINPGLYWRLIIFLALGIIFASFALGFYFYRETNKQSILDPGGIVLEETTIKKERIDVVLEYFQKREEKSVEILRSPSPVVDPSL